MNANTKNPGWQAGVSRGLGNRSQHTFTVSDWQAQMLVARFRLSPLMARELARLCFGEGRCND